MNELVFKHRLWKLQRERNKLQKSHQRATKEAEDKHADWNELQGMAACYFAQLDVIDEAIHRLHHQLIVTQAEKYLIPVPDFDDNRQAWVYSAETKKVRLRDTELVKLKLAIQREQKHRRDVWQTWLTLLTGFAGALIGLISVLG